MDVGMAERLAEEDFEKEWKEVEGVYRFELKGFIRDWFVRGFKAGTTGEFLALRDRMKGVR